MTIEVFGGDRHRAGRKAQSKGGTGMSAEQLTGFEDCIVRNELVPVKYARYHRLAGAAAAAGEPGVRAP